MVAAVFISITPSKCAVPEKVVMHTLCPLEPNQTFSHAQHAKNTYTSFEDFIVAIVRSVADDHGGPSASPGGAEPNPLIGGAISTSCSLEGEIFIEFDDNNGEDAAVWNIVMQGLKATPVAIVVLEDGVRTQVSVLLYGYTHIRSRTRTSVHTHTNTQRYAQQYAQTGTHASHAHTRTYKHVHTNLHTRTRTHVYMLTHTHLCPLTRTHLYPLTRSHSHAYIYIRTHTHASTRSHVHTHTSTHTRTYVCTYTFTSPHIHTHPHPRTYTHAYICGLPFWFSAADAHPVFNWSHFFF